jgi:aminopeptidase
MNALLVNMGYNAGEKIAIIQQERNPALESNDPIKKLDDFISSRFNNSATLCSKMNNLFTQNNIDSHIIAYAPAKYQNGEDATQEMYERIGNPDIIFAPTAFSLTHTQFRKDQTAKGARFASMPGFTLAMFEEDGPMNVDYKQIHENCERIAEKLSKSRYVEVRCQGSVFMDVEIDPTLVHVSSGILTAKGAYGNLPGAETYVVPVHEGDSYGWFQVQKGWGGTVPLEHSITFFIEGGRISNISPSPESYTEECMRYIEERVNPVIFGGENHNILAELGIGMNPKVTESYIRKYGWSTLLAEKIGGTAHFANGNSYGMGGKNNVPIHVDWVVPIESIRYLDAKMKNIQ